ncbi:MAG: hypothetical protein Q9227_002671 [Pyrenula ochraceoflavens]
MPSQANVSGFQPLSTAPQFEDIDKSAEQKSRVAFYASHSMIPVASLYQFLVEWLRRHAVLLAREFNKHLTSHPKDVSWWKRHLHKSSSNKLKYDVEQDHELEESSGLSQYSPWTLRHGFVAAMGGLAVQFTEYQDDKLFLTYDGKALFLAQYSPELLPRISLEEIEDYSKANAMAKAIACLQTAWFCIQTIFRMSAGYPVSLLELNTFGHAICALIIYVLWWYKPFDLPKPFVIDQGLVDDTGKNVLLYMKMIQEGLNGVAVKVDAPNSEDDLPKSYKISRLNGRLSNIVGRRRKPKNHPADPEGASFSQAANASETPNTLATSTVNTEMPYRESDEGCIVETGQYFPGGVFKNDDTNSAFLDSKDIADWQLISRLYSTSRADRKAILLHSMETSKRVLTPRVGNFSVTSRKRDIFYFLIVLLLSSIIYGGLHALAWTAPFPSRAEKFIWRISAISVMGGLPGVIVIFLVGSLVGTVVLTPFFFLGKIVVKLLSWLAYLPCIGSVFENIATLLDIGDDIEGVVLSLAFIPEIGAVLAFVFGRCYFIIESFIQLFHLPPKAFEVPTWSQYVPHLS